MNSFVVISAAFLALLPFCSSVPTPDPVVKLCKSDDPNLSECWKKSAQDITLYIFNGVPSRNIPPISPLYVPKHEIKGPTFSIVYTNLEFDGILTNEIRELIPDPATDSALFKSNVKNLKLKSDVTSKGNLDGVALDGTGKIVLAFENVTVDCKLKWESFTINGVKYHNVFGEAVNVDYETVKLKKFDVIKDHETLKSIKKKLNEAKPARYLHAILELYLNHLIRYTTRAFNALSTSK